MKDLSIPHKNILVSKIDQKKIKKLKWHLSGNGYLHSYDRGNYVLLHRFILSVKKGEFIDHINGIKLDNRRSNLRICSKQQNHFNSKKRKNTSSKYKGVHFYKAYNKYMAKIMLNRKSIFLGYFKTEKEAAKAYNQAARIYHGKFARLNII